MAIIFIGISFFLIDDLCAEQGKAKLKLEKSEESEEDTSTATKRFEYNGLLRFSSIANSYPEQELKDAIVKNEIRHRVRLKYGSEDVHIFVVQNAYLSSRIAGEEYGSFVYSEKSRVLKNGTFSNEWGELSFKECYLNYKTGPVRIRIGN